MPLRQDHAMQETNIAASEGRLPGHSGLDRKEVPADRADVGPEGGPEPRSAAGARVRPGATPGLGVRDARQRARGLGLFGLLRQGRHAPARVLLQGLRPDPRALQQELGHVVVGLRHAPPRGRVVGPVRAEAAGARVPQAQLVVEPLLHQPAQLRPPVDDHSGHSRIQHSQEQRQEEELLEQDKKRADDPLALHGRLDAGQECRAVDGTEAAVEDRQHHHESVLESPAQYVALLLPTLPTVIVDESPVRAACNEEQGHHGEDYGHGSNQQSLPEHCPPALITALVRAPEAGRAAAGVEEDRADHQGAEDLCCQQQCPDEGTKRDAELVQLQPRVQSCVRPPDPRTETRSHEILQGVGHVVTDRLRNGLDRPGHCLAHNALETLLGTRRGRNGPHPWCTARAAEPLVALVGVSTWASPPHILGSVEAHTDDKVLQVRRRNAFLAGDLEVRAVGRQGDAHAVHGRPHVATAPSRYALFPGATGADDDPGRAMVLQVTHAWQVPNEGVKKPGDPAHVRVRKCFVLRQEIFISPNSFDVSAPVSVGCPTQHNQLHDQDGPQEHCRGPSIPLTTEYVLHPLIREDVYIGAENSPFELLQDGGENRQVRGGTRKTAVRADSFCEAQARPPLRGLVPESAAGTLRR
mmetsp:Transcript_93838/g.265444  ORF Transcript_93838/g.265444 Transcript_93838/m.265444 type:complete len:639 (+) Transcript_93838:84-2000(+)